jgi:hypothetical protein
MPNPDFQTASYTFANWRRQIEGIPGQLTIEAMLFTDTWVTGIGPYPFLNTLATGNIPRSLRRAVVLSLLVEI